MPARLGVRGVLYALSARLAALREFDSLRWYQQWKIEVPGTRQLGKLFHSEKGDSSTLLSSSNIVE
jgi:hypothetical protein